MSLLVLLLFFAGAAGAVWIAGVKLARSTDILQDRFHLGEAFGGLILLAVATNLPEIAITVSAAFHHDLGIAVGNILGGIAAQTVVMVILDVFGFKDKGTLTNESASLLLVLEGIMVMAVLGVVIMGTQIPSSLIFARMTPEDLGIIFLWIVSLKLLSKARKGLPWEAKGAAGEKRQPKEPPEKPKTADQISTGKAVLIFVIGALVTLVAGVILEESGDAIATHIHLTGVLFGATVLAAATSLPEVSTGLAAVKSGDYELAVSDIFGGNAFLPVLFLPATLISGRATLPYAHDSDIYLSALGILLTAVYLYGLIFRPKRQFLRMGPDSLAVLILYAIGMGGLFAIAHR